VNYRPAPPTSARLSLPVFDRSQQACESPSRSRSRLPVRGQDGQAAGERCVACRRMCQTGTTLPHFRCAVARPACHQRLIHRPPGSPDPQRGLAAPASLELTLGGARPAPARLRRERALCEFADAGSPDLPTPHPDSRVIRSTAPPARPGRPEKAPWRSAGNAYRPHGYRIELSDRTRAWTILPARGPMVYHHARGVEATVPDQRLRPQGAPSSLFVPETSSLTDAAAPARAVSSMTTSGRASGHSLPDCSGEPR